MLSDTGTIYGQEQYSDEDVWTFVSSTEGTPTCIRVFPWWWIFCIVCWYV